ncbi:MAG: thiolase family protein [Candidatus Eisenbacteria bacterium]|uniref:Thiolase family protein n=1 Tax=Eiseniibacteriota bacterium TaxID=2212470 RepID=A0A538SRJ1_UNCEI|nr:MAG: thiolase family protein [Candidatus Eisenbacteria bacterium]
MHRVAIVAGARTPFVRAGKAFASLGPLALAKHAVGGLLERHRVDATEIEAIAFGVVVPEPGKPNLAREIVLETGLPAGIEAQTVSSYCITGLRSATIIADAIARGRIRCGIAGGVEWLSGADPSTFREPSTGLTMGEHMEITCKEWRIPRERQDEVALASHRNAVAARDLLAREIVPVEGIEHDSGPRPDTSMEKLAALKPSFDPAGTITAGNASPVTDGASAVLLMSEERAREAGREPLAFIETIGYAAIHPREGLLMAPAIAVPRLLKRAEVTLADVDLLEIHEAFAAQVIANVTAWEQGWKEPAIRPVDWKRVNVNGSSVAVGHPWAATGGRILTTLAYEMERRRARRGLISICAAGAMAGATLLTRD